MLLMIPMTRFISKKLAAIQSQLMRVKDRRINTTSEWKSRIAFADMRDTRSFFTATSQPLPITPHRHTHLYSPW